MGIYEHYYNCRQEPFRLNPDPNFLYLASSHREALAQLRYTVETRRGFAVLTGEVGTGKSTLLRALLERVSDDVQTGYIFNPPLSLAELYAAIAAEWDVALGDAASRRYDLNRYLLAKYVANRNLVLIFDEAQSIAPEVLHEIRLLSNLETAQTKLMQIILAGQPEFDTMLDSPELRALRQRVAMRHRLLPLDQNETAEYMASRLRIAGAAESPFTAAACQRVFHYAHGIPRLINLICDNAMLAAYAENQKRIEKDAIESVAQALSLKRSPATGNPAAGRDTPPSVEETVHAAPRRRFRLASALGLLTLFLLELLMLVSLVGSPAGLSALSVASAGSFAPGPSAEPVATSSSSRSAVLIGQSSEGRHE
jgi:general secretion pathway protein A